MGLGLFVGFGVGVAVGPAVGAGVGAAVGAAVGAGVGAAVGAAVGGAVGAAVGIVVGLGVGRGVGVGVRVGVPAVGVAVAGSFGSGTPAPGTSGSGVAAPGALVGAAGGLLELGPTPSLASLGWGDAPAGSEAAADGSPEEPATCPEPAAWADAPGTIGPFPGCADGGPAVSAPNPIATPMPNPMRLPRAI